jgi:glycerol-3-phosphate acyltransferase PlsY
MKLLLLFCVEFVFFLVGGIPFGYLLVKLQKGEDIRRHGSGNIGATNVWRFMGPKYGVLVFLLDGLKSFLPILLAKNFLEDTVWWTMLAVVSGHIYSPWLGWRGGKGIASFIWGLVAINGKLAGLMIFTWLSVFGVFRISGLAALAALTVTLVMAGFLLNRWIDYGLLLMTGALIYMAHRKNIQDIWKRYWFNRT